MGHWPWDLRSPRFQTQWCGGEIPTGYLLLGLTWGLHQGLVSRVCCCVPQKKKKPHVKVGLLPRGQNPLSYYTL
jgi:hypothetical protein